MKHTQPFKQPFNNMKRDLVAHAMKGLFLFVLLLLTGNAELKAQVVVTGFNAPDEQLGGVRYRSFANTGGDEIFIGIPDLGVAANRSQTNILWAQGVNQVVFIYDKTNDKLKTTVTNMNGTYQLEYLNFSTQLTAKGKVNSPSKMNVMQVTVASRDSGSSAAFKNVKLDGIPLGDFALSGFNDWMVENYNFGNGFTLTGDIELSGSFSGSQENSRIELRIGVRLPATISKQFGSQTMIPLNGMTSLTFTLTNSSTKVAQQAVAFTDNLPSGLVVATPNGLVNGCGGTVSAMEGSSSITLSNGTIGINTSCTIVVNVKGTTLGVKDNTTGAISSTNADVNVTGATSNTASLTVVAPLMIAKQFGAQTIALNGTTSLTFTLSNPNATVVQSGVAFSDPLPSGLVVATPNGLINGCGGTVSAMEGSSSITLSNGMIGVNTSCTIVVNVTGAAGGVKYNTTGAISSTEGGTGSASNTATLSVNTPPTINAVATSRRQGSPTSNSTIANVNDAEDAEETLSIKVNGGTSATVNGVTVSNIAVSAAGVVTADVVATCTATNASFTLRVTDSQSVYDEATLNVTVTANTAPVLSYGALQNVIAGSGATINPATGPSDNGSVTTIIVQNKGTFTGTVAVNAAGVVTISNAAPLGSHTITIRATDNCSVTTDATFTLVVSALTVVIADPAICTGPGGAVDVTATVTNGANSSQSATFTASLPAGLLAVPGTCSANVGTCNVVNGSTVSWSGNLAGNQTVTIKYKAQIGDQVVTGTQLCITSSGTVGSSSAGSVVACLTVNCPALGTGVIPDAKSPASDQKAGSVLFYNIYSSDAANYNAQNTRISITNVHPVLRATVHLFFVDGVSCTAADQYICLTPNQTYTFLASDIDPGTTGYLVAVAVDDRGCPIDFNYLIGDEYIKLNSGHAANLGAEAISALAGGLPLCDLNSTTATLNFDGVSYNGVPRVLAVDNIPAKGDGNETLLILNRFGGNLSAGGASLGTIFGLLYDDVEQGYSFNITGGCQLRNSLSNSFPRTAPRFESAIPPGRTGWMKLYSLSDIGMFGAAINLNKNSNVQSGAFNQGHNLHKLTLTQAATLIIPVFPPKC